MYPLEAGVAAGCECQELTGSVPVGARMLAGGPRGSGNIGGICTPIDGTTDEPGCG